MDNADAARRGASAGAFRFGSVRPDRDGFVSRAADRGGVRIDHHFALVAKALRAEAQQEGFGPGGVEVHLVAATLAVAGQLRAVERGGGGRRSVVELVWPRRTGADRGGGAAWSLRSSYARSPCGRAIGERPMAAGRDGGYYGGMNIRFSLGVLMAAAMAMAGCQSTPQKRIAKNEATFAAMSPEARAAIREGRVEIGFTPVQVELARGKPARVVRRTTAQGEERSWIYEGRGSRLGVGLGVGAGGGGVGGGVGLSSGARGPNVSYVVHFAGGVVRSVEDYGGR